MEEYRRFKNLEYRPPETAVIYPAVAIMLAEKGFVQLCTEVVEDMLRAGHRPSPRLGFKHFGTALDQNNEEGLHRALELWPSSLVRMDKA